MTPASVDLGGVTIYIYIYIYVHACMHAWMYVCMYVCRPWRAYRREKPVDAKD